MWRLSSHVPCGRSGFSPCCVLCATHDRNEKALNLCSNCNYYVTTTIIIFKHQNSWLCTVASYITTIHVRLQGSVIVLLITANVLSEKSLFFSIDSLLKRAWGIFFLMEGFLVLCST